MCLFCSTCKILQVLSEVMIDFNEVIHKRYNESDVVGTECTLRGELWINRVYENNSEIFSIKLNIPPYELEFSRHFVIRFAKHYCWSFNVYKQRVVYAVKIVSAYPEKISNQIRLNSALERVRAEVVGNSIQRTHFVPNLLTKWWELNHACAVFRYRVEPFQRSY